VRLSKLFLVVVFVLSGVMMAWAANQMMSVQVRQGKLRDKPLFLAKIIGKLVYGQQVSTLKKQGSWVEVSAGKDKRGWMHVSALSEKKIVLRSGKEDVKAKTSQEEYVLAGKGFNSEVESKYRAENAELNYAWVDKAEKEFNVSPTKLVAFVRKGKLTPLKEIKIEKRPTQSSGPENNAR